eukprot:252117-Rhodomonas_salina.1
MPQVVDPRPRPYARRQQQRVAMHAARTRKADAGSSLQRASAACKHCNTHSAAARSSTKEKNKARGRAGTRQLAAPSGCGG